MASLLMRFFSSRTVWTRLGVASLPAGTGVVQTLVSRRLECYRARIVAPLAMLLSAAYGESHCECARQGRVRASHLSTLPTRKAPGEATDPGRVLPGRRLSPEAR